MTYLYGGIIGAAIVVGIDVVVYLYRARIRRIAKEVKSVVEDVKHL